MTILFNDSNIRIETSTRIHKVLRADIHHIENAHQCKGENGTFHMMCNGGCKFQKQIHNQEVCRYSLLSDEMDALLNLLYIGGINDEEYFQQRI